jgi:hypothetical protein
MMVRAIALAACACVVPACSHDATRSAASPSPTLPITTGDYPAYGHAADFSWISGQLQRSTPAGQCTYIVFATRPGAPWGGRIALAPSSRDGAFPDGDMVVVTGELVSSPLGVCGHPSMSVTTIAEH